MVMHLRISTAMIWILAQDTITIMKTNMEPGAQVFTILIQFMYIKHTYSIICIFIVKRHFYKLSIYFKSLSDKFLSVRIFLKVSSPTPLIGSKFSKNLLDY